MGSYPFAGAPLSSVQIDYWLYDLEVVNETTRNPIGRPCLTMLIDTFSFMPTGYYLSLDPPGAANAGMAIFHSITRKEKWLAGLGVEMEWPVWGFMKMIHADNAKEFRGTMMQRFVSFANTKLVNRKVHTPRYGPHIERYFGKLAQSVKHLPGATGSNIRERAKKRDPRKTASLTLADLELYLLSVIKEHINTPRAELGMSPLEKWRSYFFDPETGRQVQKLRRRLVIWTDYERSFCHFRSGRSSTTESSGTFSITTPMPSSFCASGTPKRQTRNSWSGATPTASRRSTSGTTRPRCILRSRFVTRGAFR